MKTAFLLVPVWMQSVVVLAANIPVHNTGVNASDVLVAPGAQASFWTLSAKPAGATETIGSNPFRFNCCYVADTSTAAWVSPQAGGNAGVTGTYTYDLVFDLTGFNPATAQISGTFSSDNDGTISLNGNPPVATSCFACFSSTTPFTMNSGFVAGLNTIHVAVNNGGDPTAFFVQFTTATATPTGGPSVPATPIPGTVWLAMAGIAMLSLLFWWRKAAF